MEKLRAKARGPCPIDSNRSGSQNYGVGGMTGGQIWINMVAASRTSRTLPLSSYEVELAACRLSFSAGIDYSYSTLLSALVHVERRIKDLHSYTNVHESFRLSSSLLARPADEVRGFIARYHRRTVLSLIGTFLTEP